MLMRQSSCKRLTTALFPGHMQETIREPLTNQFTNVSLVKRIATMILKMFGRLELSITRELTMLNNLRNDNERVAKLTRKRPDL